MTILIADDEPALLRILDWNFSRAGFTVWVATDGEQAIHGIRANRPQAALLDAMMPVLTGPEVCRLVRADPALKDMKLGLLSAKGPDEASDLAGASGADFYETKPFSPGALVVRIQSMLAPDAETRP